MRNGPSKKIQRVLNTPLYPEKLSKTHRKTNFTGRLFCRTTTVDWTLFIMSLLSDGESKKEQPVKHILSCHSNIYESEQFFYIPQCIHFHSLGRFTYDVHENCHIFKTPNSTCPAASKFLPPP